MAIGKGYVLPIKYPLPCTLVFPLGGWDDLTAMDEAQLEAIDRNYQSFPGRRIGFYGQMLSPGPRLGGGSTPIELIGAV